MINHRIPSSPCQEIPDPGGAAPADFAAESVEADSQTSAVQACRQPLGSPAANVLVEVSAFEARPMKTLRPSSPAERSKIGLRLNFFIKY